MLRPNRSLGVLAALAIASFVAAGCGESVDDAESKLCADLATLRANVAALAEINADSSVDEFEKARQNVESSMQDVEADADNLGEEKEDALEDAWDDFEDSIDDIDDDQSLADAASDIQSAAQTFQQTTNEIRGKLNCSGDKG